MQVKYKDDIRKVMSKRRPKGFGEAMLGVTGSCPVHVRLFPHRHRAHGSCLCTSRIGSAYATEPWYTSRKLRGCQRVGAQVMGGTHN